VFDSNYQFEQDAFTIDNKRVWQEVKALVIDGFGWSYIK
jgi:hypothetical protein